MWTLYLKTGMYISMKNWNYSGMTSKLSETFPEVNLNFFCAVLGSSVETCQHHKLFCNIFTHFTHFCVFILPKDIQSPSNAYKRFWSIIRKLAVVFLFVKIQNILIRNVWKTQKFAISLSIRTFKILKVTRILG